MLKELCVLYKVKNSNTGYSVSIINNMTIHFLVLLFCIYTGTMSLKPNIDYFVSTNGAMEWYYLL